MFNKKHIFICAALVFSMNFLTAGKDGDNTPAPAPKTDAKVQTQPKKTRNSFLARLLGQNNAEKTQEESTSEILAKSISSTNIITLKNIIISETKNLKFLITQFNKKEIDEEALREKLGEIITKIIDSVEFKKTFNFLFRIISIVEDPQETQEIINSIPDLKLIIKFVMDNIQILMPLAISIGLPHPELMAALTSLATQKLPKLTTLSIAIEEKIKAEKQQQTTPEEIK